MKTLNILLSGTQGESDWIRQMSEALNAWSAQTQRPLSIQIYTPGLEGEWDLHIFVMSPAWDADGYAAMRTPNSTEQHYRLDEYIELRKNYHLPSSAYALVSEGQATWNSDQQEILDKKLTDAGFIAFRRSYPRLRFSMKYICEDVLKYLNRTLPDYSEYEIKAVLSAMEIPFEEKDDLLLIAVRGLRLRVKPTLNVVPVGLSAHPIDGRLAIMGPEIPVSDADHVALDELAERLRQKAAELANVTNPL